MRAPKLMLALDGRADSDRVVDHVAAREWPMGTQARLVGVEEDITYLQNVVPGHRQGKLNEVKKSRSAWLDQRFSGFRNRLEARGLAVIVERPEGDPREILPKRAAETRTDCLFLGSRGLGEAERFLLGSVSSSVAGHVRCTVEIVRSAGAGRCDRNTRVGCGIMPIRQASRQKDMGDGWGFRGSSANTG
jgi:nucleotide-binding universal stress UspA family protein